MVKNTRKIKIAAVQMESENCKIDENLEHASEYVNKAVDKGAQIVVLPEFMPTGYIMTEEIWSAAETDSGKTVNWLKHISKSLGVWVGTSFLEAEDEDFYNTFVLSSADGEIAGKVRKTPPASVEAYFMKSGGGSRYIDTELGRIGISICGENIFCNSITELHEASVDMVIQPTSAPTVTKKFPFRQKDVESVYNLVEKTPLIFALKLGVPVILANKCGEWHSPVPGLSPDQHSRFTGSSSIVDSDGVVKAKLGRNEEGIIVEEVTLDPSKKSDAPPVCDGRWSMPMPWFAFLYPIAQKMGERSYNKSINRIEMAKLKSKG